jgi:signal transduction histidine kinase
VSSRIYREMLDGVYRRSGRVFVWLFLLQWVFAIGWALVISPYAYVDGHRVIHFHVKAAIVFGAVINAMPLLLIRFRNDWFMTRHVVAAAQMLWSALLIMISGGRIETHFHVFGSLAFLAFYRDWKILVTATVMVAADHLARGLFWPETVYGIDNPEWWRFLEHAAWVAFEVVVLSYGSVRSHADMRAAAEREARLQRTNAIVEEQVRIRTRELERSMEQLAQAQKLESVGRLAAGVAHEINTPIQYIADSIQFAHDAVVDLRDAGILGSDIMNEDFEYMVDELPTALERALEGTQRVASIVRSMKVFAHPERDKLVAYDLEQALRETINVARNEYKYVADVKLVTETLPQVVCYPAELNQVFLNIIVNAAHAIDDVVRGTPERGTITVTANRQGDDVVVSIADTGCGIPDTIRDRIFDPFFTTKPVGRGTGQGLAISRSVVAKHGGQLTFDSVLGQGTTFHIRIPLEARKEAA